MRTNLDEFLGALSRMFSGWTADRAPAADGGGNSGMGGFASVTGAAKLNLLSNGDDESGDT